MTTIFTEEDLVNVPRTPEGAYDLRNVIIRDANLSHADLRGADFRGATLVHTHFLNANLEGALFQDTTLQYMVFREANLRGAHFENATISACALKGADMRDAHLQNATIRSILTNVYLHGANIEGTIFQQIPRSPEVSLQSANMQETKPPSISIRTLEDLQASPRITLRNGAQIYNLIGADLSGASLQGADLRGANLEAANLRGANLQGANLTQTVLSSANLQDADLRGAVLSRTKLNYTILRNTDLRDVSLPNCEFRGAVLYGAQLLGADFRNVQNNDGIYIEDRNTRTIEDILTQRTGIDHRRAAAAAAAAAIEPVDEGAYEIHNAFKKVNIREMIPFLESIVENGVERSNSLSRLDSARFITEVNHNMGLLLMSLPESSMNHLPPRNANYYPEHIKNWRDIWFFIYNHRIKHVKFDDPYKKRAIGLALLYATSQPRLFQENYVMAYLNEVGFAYTNGDDFINNISCTKGIIERFVSALKPAVEAALTTEVPEDTKYTYKRLYNFIIGGYNEDVAMKLITEWQETHKHVISKDGSFRENKEELVRQQRGALITMLCCELAVSEDELMKKPVIKTTIDYVFGDDNIIDNTLGGSKKKTSKNKKTNKKKTTNKKTTKPNKKKTNKTRKPHP